MLIRPGFYHAAAYYVYYKSTYGFWPIVLTVALMQQCCVRLSSSVCNVKYYG